MAFKIDAYVLSQIPGKQTGQSWPLYDLKSVGIWPGEEIRDSGDNPDGALTGITTRLRAMTKAKPKEKKPMTFSWAPTSRDEKVLFNSILRNRSFEIRIGVKAENDFFLLLNFFDVKLMKTPLRKKGVEQIEATFIDFRTHP